MLCRYQEVVENKFAMMNRIDKERVIVPLLEHMDQGAKCRLITCPFHNHGRDPRALSAEELQAAIDAAQRDAAAKAEADAAAALEAEQQALRESVAGQRLRRWLKKRGAVGCGGGQARRASGRVHMFVAVVHMRATP